MGLSSELASQFAKVTNDTSRNTNGTKLYGTITMLGEVPHVKLDGTEELTPISRTVEVAEGDRVEVTIANHSATVTGNLTDPSIGVMRAGNLESKIEQTAEAIRLEVSDLGQNLQSSINQTATEIRSEVSDLDGRFSENVATIENGIREDLTEGLASLSTELTNMDNSIRDDLGGEISGLEEQTNSSISTINASIESLTFNVSELDSKITQTATEIRSEVSAKVTDLSATIVDTESGIRDTIDVKVADLDSKITQTATSIRSEVSASFETVDGKITNLDSKIAQNATSITTLVSKDEEFSQFKQTVESFSFMNKGGTVKISGGNLDLTGAITFSDLNSATQTRITNVESTASTASTNASTALTNASNAWNRAGTAIDDAADAWNKAVEAYGIAKSITVPDYIKSTYIDATTIKSPNIEGNNIKVHGTFQTIGYDGVSQITTGYMGAAMGKDSYGNDTLGVALSTSWNSSDGTIGNGYVIVTNAGVRLQFNKNQLIVSPGGIYVNTDTANGKKAFYNGTEIGIGSGTAVFG